MGQKMQVLTSVFVLVFLFLFFFCCCYITGIHWTEPLTNIECLMDKKQMTLNELCRIDQAFASIL